MAVSQYPRWEVDRIVVSPADLPSLGGEITARIWTEDAKDPALEGVTFTLVSPGGRRSSEPGTSCGATSRGSHTSRCWETVLSFVANATGVTRHYAVEVSTDELDESLTESLTVSHYPRWMQETVEVEPASLPSSGGMVTATISTLDITAPSVEPVAFTITLADGSTSTVPGSGCGVVVEDDHTSRCWQVSFEARQNATTSPQSSVDVSTVACDPARSVDQCPAR